MAYMSFSGSTKFDNSVDVFYQNCSTNGNEVYVHAFDFQYDSSESAQEELTGGTATFIMSPQQAREFAALLCKVADECEAANKY